MGKNSGKVFNIQQEAWSVAWCYHYSRKKSLQEGMRLVLLTQYQATPATLSSNFPNLSRCLAFSGHLILIQLNLFQNIQNVCSIFKCFKNITFIAKNFLFPAERSSRRQKMTLKVLSLNNRQKLVQRLNISKDAAIQGKLSSISFSFWSLSMVECSEKILQDNLKIREKGKC